MKPATKPVDASTPSAANPKQVKLKFPISDGTGRTVDTITLRRGTLKDLKVAQRNADYESADVDTWLVAILAAEGLTFEAVESLDLADWTEVQVCLRGII
jgi:hypothetical protein